jgi:STE24 endopeptidase
VARAEAFRGPQSALFLASTAIELGVLVLLARRPPAWLGRARRPVLAGAAAGALLSLATSVAPLPVSAISRHRAMDVGLVTQSWGGWAGDVLKSLGIGAAIAAAGGAFAVFLLRRAGRWWWVPASAVVVAFGAILTYAGPVVLDPLFNKFTPLPAGQTRSDVLELAERAGVEVGEVYVTDASRRTTAANAYVTGLGHTKRVVLYDTLIDADRENAFTRDEVRLVVAHELGHVHFRDVPQGLLYLLLVAPAGMFAVARVAERLGPARTGAGARRPARVDRLAPALAAGGGAGRQLRAEAHGRAGAVHRLRAPDRDPQRVGP